MSFSESSLKDELVQATDGSESRGTFCRIRSKISTGIALESDELSLRGYLELDIADKLSLGSESSRLNHAYALYPGLV